ncbi:hypothetical protein I4U23_012593 [Adineta vaga]|nr:hypothetical protein I4U23_012593 [Adineta vaga]
MSFIDWNDLFDEIFEGYSHKWTLKQAHRHATHMFGHLQTQRCMERTKYAKFHCPKCSKGWASAKAKVDLYYPNFNQRLGQVTIRFYGQECRRCSRKGTYYVDPEFELDDIRFILEKLYERIGWDCYHKERPKTTKTYVERDNKIQGPHEEKLCEACKMGRCDQVSRKTK